MDCLEHGMLGVVDLCALLLCRRAPKKKNHPRPGTIDCSEDGIGKRFPTEIFVLHWLALLDGQQGVQHEHTLARPPAQIAMTAFDPGLLVHILQGRRNGGRSRNRKAKSHGLIGPVVWVLPDDYHANRIKVAELERREHFLWRWIDNLLLPRRLDLGHAGLEVRLLELGAQCGLPFLPEKAHPLRTWFARLWGFLHDVLLLRLGRLSALR